MAPVAPPVPEPTAGCWPARFSEEIPIAVAIDRDKTLQAAQKLVERKRYDKAVIEYQKLVTEDPKDVRTLLRIGDLYLKMEQHVDAITTYERVGQFYSAQGFHLKAIAVYKQIREIIHKHVPHLEDRFGHIVPKLAETYAQLGLTSDALSTYDEVATRYQRAGRDRDAIDIFRKVVDLDPQNPLPHLRLAEAFVRVRDIDDAMERFHAAAEILLKLGRRDDALKVVERLLQHRPEANFARVAAEIYLERGEPSDAMAALTKLQICFKEDPKNLDTLGLLSRAFDKLGQPAKAVEVQKEAARIAKDTGKVEQFNALVEALLARAPDDDAVRLLAGARSPAPPPVATGPQANPSPVAPSATSTAKAPQAAPIPPAKPGEPPSKPAKPAPVVVDTSAEVEVEEAEVLLDDEISAVEAPFVLRPSAAPEAPPDLTAWVRQVLTQVDGLRRAAASEQAVQLLCEAIESLPESRELREKLCDVLIEMGEQGEAIHQMLIFARWLGTEGDVDGAARLLDEVLLLEPSQPEALAMLRELGYSVGPEVEVEYAGETPLVPLTAPYDPNAPLPSYDLEEVSAEDALAHHSPRPFAPSQLDDPFAEGNAPLPSFPIDEEAQVPENGVASEPALASGSQFPGRRSSHRPVGEGAPLDEQALEEVEFFTSQGMFDEARALLEEQLQRLPSHPLLIERLRELEEHASASGGGSGTRAVPRTVSSHAPGSSEDRAFDIAASLDALDALDAGPAAHDGDQVSIDSVFEQFKAGVAAQISESDAETHYNLGIAYKELGLFSDAIAEFELAARDPARDCVCQSTIGMIYRELGNVDAAIGAFIRGLHANTKTSEQELALTYEIGDCYEIQRSTEQALYYFQRVARMDAAYNDARGSVSDRIRRLDKPVAKPTARAVGAEIGDEFDAALDDLLRGAKLP